MANCPFCSDVLLRHIRSGRAYWLCRRCRTEILEKEFERTVLLKSRQKAIAEGGLASLGKPQPALGKPQAVRFDDLPIRVSPKS